MPATALKNLKKDSGHTIGIHSENAVLSMNDVLTDSTHLDENRIHDNNDWQECELFGSKEKYYVHVATGAAQWDAPVDGMIKPLTWSFSRALLQLSIETKLMVGTFISVGLLSSGFIFGYWREQRRNNVSAIPLHKLVTMSSQKIDQPSRAVRTSSTNRINPIPKVRRKKLRPLPASKRQQAAKQAIRALGIATMGSVVTFGAFVCLTAAALGVSNAKEFGNQMRTVVPQINKRIGHTVTPISNYLKSKIKTSRVVQKVREMRKTATLSNDDQHATSITADKSNDH